MIIKSNSDKTQRAGESVNVVKKVDEEMRGLRNVSTVKKTKCCKLLYIALPVFPKAPVVAMFPLDSELGY